MGVSRRQWKDALGRTRVSKYYSYRVQVNGREYSGTTGKTRRDQAEAWESSFVRRVLEEESAKELVERYRDVLAGGAGMLLWEAFPRFLTKPRSKAMSANREKATRSRWTDFLWYMADTRGVASEGALEPRLGDLRMADVTRQIGEVYIHHIRTEGRWRKTISARRGKRRKKIVTYESRLVHIAPNTCNDFLQTCRMVFQYLMDDTGLPENPFAHISKQMVVQQNREAFTQDELRFIGERAEEPLLSLFLCGICTGLTRGDICTLEWQSVDLTVAPGWIITARRKTNAELRIPLMAGLRRHLEQLAAGRPRGERYVFPELAELYETNEGGITYRVNKFFAELNEDLAREGMPGIGTTKQPKGRTRRVSVKGVHSLRHTFIYLAGLHGMPFPVVQSIVGHLTKQMTALYMDHASDEAKRVHLASMPDYLSVVPAPAPGEHRATARDKMLALLDGMTEETWDECRRELRTIVETVPIPDAPLTPLPRPPGRIGHMKPSSHTRPAIV